MNKKEEEQKTNLGEKKEEEIKLDEVDDWEDLINEDDNPKEKVVQKEESKIPVKVEKK